VKRTGIYKIESKIHPNRCYVGSAVNISKRWNYHLEDLIKNKHANNRLQNHYNKYGKNDLLFSILICCDKENLIANEQFFIDSYNPYFNICKVAGSSLGRSVSKETRQKLREIKLQNPNSKESNLKISKALNGKSKTKEHAKNISLGKTGKKLRPLTEEHKNKTSKTMQGVCKSEDHINNMKKAWELRRMKNTNLINKN